MVIGNLLGNAGFLWRNTYADYFLHYNGSVDKINNSVERLMGLLFGNPYINSTFNEHAMYLAYVAGMRSGDLSRQIGAVVANQEKKEILSIGANECPAYGGGQYWPVYDKSKEDVVEVENGKDFKRGEDFNHRERLRLYEDVCASLGLEATPDNMKKLDASSLHDITEYGRMVHAEMEAILGCARRGIPMRGATLFCTTFPCHNCAKHIISSGILRVLYIEPYPKSKALTMHPEALSLNEADQGHVVFEPYVGVGPRRYVDLFSMDLGVGVPIKRKDESTGKVLVYDKGKAIPRLRMYPGGYEEREELVVSKLNDYLGEG
jgi:deoxycytidylate deaminase